MRIGIWAAAAAVAALSAPGPSAAQIAGSGIVEAGSGGAGDTGLGRSNAVVGLGVGISPDYEGSDVYKYGLVPFGRFSWREYQQYLELGPHPGSRNYQARLNVLPYEGIELGPLVAWRPGRGHVGNKQVRSLPNIDSAAEVGGFARWWIPTGLPRQAVALDVSGAADVTNAYDGWWVQPGVAYRAGVSESVTVTGRIFSDWADGDYMQTYFGIDASQAAKSGLRQENADAGFKDVGLTLNVTWQFATHWFTGAAGTYERMLGDAGSSPVTRNAGNKNQGFGGLYVGYRF